MFIFTSSQLHPMQGWGWPRETKMNNDDNEEIRPPACFHKTFVTRNQNVIWSGLTVSTLIAMEEENI